jgi:uncharacterized protein (TIGR02646 family)
MRRIEKKKIEPKELTNHRNEQKKKGLKISFGGLPANVKRAIKESLLDEQGYICCYCMQKIDYDKMKVEHFFTQTSSKKSKDIKDQDAVIDYSNLLGACEGNKDVKGRENHCDSCRDGSNLSFKSPASKDFNLKVEYVEKRSEEQIIVKESIFEKELTCNNCGKGACLNLNEKFLAEKRYNVWKAIQNVLFKESKQTEWQVKTAKQLIEKYQTKKEGKYPEFCEMVVFLLKKRFKNELEKSA